MAGMMIVGRLARRVDLRYLMVVGTLLMIFSLWEMTLFTAEVSSWDIIRTGVVQGLGLGLVFVPLSTMAFSTLAPKYRTEGTALYSLIRNIGSSIGISVVTTYLAHRVQINHAAFSEYITPFSHPLHMAAEKGMYDISTQVGLLSIDAEVNRQAAILGYLQDYRLMMFVCVVMLPLIFLLKRTKS